MAQRQYTEEALDILKRVPLIDGHNDWAFFIRGFYKNKLDSRFDEDRDLASQVDIKRLVKGRSGGVFLSAFVHCPKKENDFSDEAHLPLLLETMQQIDLCHRLVDRYSSHLTMCNSSEDILPIHQSGKIACMIGIEGLHQLGNSSSVLRMCHKLGARYVTLSHTSNNKYCDASTAPPVHGGLSEAGKTMILEMNRIGMLLDISHVSNDTALDAMKLSLAPVAYTHSSLSALVAHPRNVPDTHLDALKSNNGIIMISLVPQFTTSDPQHATIDGVVDHILHVATRIGFEHVGIGSDYDGILTTVKGLEDVSCFPALVAGMLERGIGVDDVEKVVGWNVLRVLRDVERVARERGEGLPVLEDEVEYTMGEEERADWRRQFPDAEHDVTV